MHRHTIVALTLAALLGAACSPGSGTALAPTNSVPLPTSEDGGSPAVPASTGSGGVDGSGNTGTKVLKVDPRKGGLELGFGEWAVTPEAQVVRPGPITFVVVNRGTMLHGFEIEREGDDGDSSGPGSGDGFKVESRLIGPGETDRITLDLAPGVYKIECKVDGHDDLGMEFLLEVRTGAPLARKTVGGAQADPTAVAIEGFAFQPDTLRVEVGLEVTWTNADPTAHTVTADDGTFGSDPLDRGASFATTFGSAGTFAYFCAIHPEMRGTIEVG